MRTFGALGKEGERGEQNTKSSTDPDWLLEPRSGDISSRNRAGDGRRSGNSGRKDNDGTCS